jgi:hypothetical protein
MIPEIRKHTKSALCPAAPQRLEAFVAQVVASAFEVYRRLAESGLSDLVYPKPLTATALVWLRHVGSGNEK